MRLVVVIQARTGSTRLPGKVLLPLGGRSLLERMIERVRAARTEFELVVATTDEAADDPIAEVCRHAAVRCFRGHPTDLLDRHYQAARALGADAVAKIPSDCPLIDPAAIDRVLGHFLRNAQRFDFVSNLHPASWPDGNDVEVMPLGMLAEAWTHATRRYEREHTTPFIWDQPDRYRLGSVRWETGLDYSASHRFTIDYPEDYTLIRTLFDELWTPTRPVFSLADVLQLLRQEPDLLRVNDRWAGTSWLDQHRGELQTLPQEAPGTAVRTARKDPCPTAPL
jgi:spore coat polysaccharide biosynthesis protein SpsF